MNPVEEVVVWKKSSPTVAIRYVGFRNIETGKVWFACANYLSPDSDESTFEGDFLGIEVLASIFLTDLPTDESEWKSGLPEALEYFLSTNPGR